VKARILRLATSGLLGIVVVAAIVLFAAPSAQAQARGPLIILGLRAPDGADDAANNATTALRRAARTAGYAVPTDSPALEQSMAAFGCDDSLPPECLTQIAGDLHADRIVYGSVRTQGRGDTATFAIEISLFDSARHTVVGHAQASVPRAMGADGDALGETARGLVSGVVGGGGAGSQSASAGSSSVPSAGSGAAVPGAGSSGAPGGGSPATPFPLRRYASYGAMGLGGAMVVGGFIVGIAWLSYSGSIDQPGQPWYQYWESRPGVPASCSGIPASDTSANAVGARNACGTSSGMVAAEFALVGIGAALAVGGVILMVTDRNAPRDSAAPAPSSTARRRAPAMHVMAAPVVSPGFTGGMLEVRF